MNKRDLYQAGYQRGRNIASWQDMPEVGYQLPKHIDWVGLGQCQTKDERIDAWVILCTEAEGHDRDFSPFEFTARDINHSHDPEGLWEAFDSGITAGIRAYRRKHYPLKGKW